MCSIVGRVGFLFLNLSSHQLTSLWPQTFSIVTDCTRVFFVTARGNLRFDSHARHPDTSV